MPVRVVTDSLSSLPPRLVAGLGIDVVPLFVVDGGIATPETEIDLDDFYRRLEQMQTLPTTAQASLEDLTASFHSIVERGDEVLGVFVSEVMSGTVQAARVAADVVRADIPSARIEIVDSRSNCMQEGLAATTAAALATAGGSMQECVEACRATIRRTRYLFSPATLEYLRRGGRIGTASALLGQLLQIRPVLTVEHGQTETFVKVRTQAKALAAMASTFAEEVRDHGLQQVFVHFISDRDTAQRFAEEQIAPITGAPVEVVAVSPVIGVHVGPAVGIVYETVEPLRDAQ